MKKMFFVLAGLILIDFSVFSAGFSLFGGGKAGAAADKTDSLEVPDTDPVPRHNPAAYDGTAAGVGQAGGPVWAERALPLTLEEEDFPKVVKAITGVKNQKISEPQDRADWEAVDIVVSLPVSEKESFSQSIPEGLDVSDWIENLPQGLEARAHRVKKNATEIRIYISGTPEETSRAEIKVTIPSTYLKGGMARTFVSPTRQESDAAFQERLQAAEKAPGTQQ